uniref:UspA domain-containing protein n=1 Tax=Araucaria cunninghamii TaxID=56994 RepID=A0A0D6QSJ2_ARACU
MADVKKIMVAVDESECSHYALEWTLNNLYLYRKDDSIPSLVVLHVQPFVTISGAGTMGVTPPELVEVLVNQQKQFSEALLARAKDICTQKNVTVDTMAEMGDPKDTICDVVEKKKIDLLVVGSHGYGMVKRALMGSVSGYCVNHAKCPVLVVRKPS